MGDDDNMVPTLNAAVAATPPILIPGGANNAGTASIIVPYIDKTREKIAYLLLAILIGVIAIITLVALIYSASCWFSAAQCAAAQKALPILTDAIQPVFTAMIGIVGSVVGFYFGSKES